MLAGLSLVHVIILLLTDSAAGFASSLLGIGGGVFMNPVQYLVFTSIGVPADAALKLAFGTSVLVILPTAISGVWRHHQKGAVLWKAALIMGSCSAVASFGGSTLAAHLHATELKIAFGVVILISGIRMLTSTLPRTEETPRNNIWLWVACALPIGFFSGLFGVGGGIVAIPVMTMALRFKIHNAVATSLAMMILTSIGGAIGYIRGGIGVPDLPAYSIGYVNLPSLLLLVVTSIGMAQVGALTAHRLPAKQLRYIFIALTFYMALKMLGLFDWLGWPI